MGQVCTHDPNKNGEPENNLSRTIEKNFMTFKEFDKLKTLKEEDINLIKEIQVKNYLTQKDIEKLKSIKDSEILFKDMIKNEDENVKNEPKSNLDLNRFPSFLSKMTVLKNLCPNHMIDDLYEHFVSALSEEKIFREKMTKIKIKFFKENLIKSLKKN